MNHCCLRGFEASFRYKSTLWDIYSHLGRVFFLRCIHWGTSPSGRYIILVCVISQWISFQFSLRLRSNLPMHNPKTYIFGGWSQRMTPTLTSFVGCRHRSKRGSIIFMTNPKIRCLKMIGWLIFLGCLSVPLLVYSWIFQLQEQRALALMVCCFCYSSLVRHWRGTTGELIDKLCFQEFELQIIYPCSRF